MLIAILSSLQGLDDAVASIHAVRNKIKGEKAIKGTTTMLILAGKITTLYDAGGKKKTDIPTAWLHELAHLIANRRILSPLYQTSIVLLTPAR